jgi:hypothetical protein
MATTRATRGGRIELMKMTINKCHPSIHPGDRFDQGLVPRVLNRNSKKFTFNNLAQCTIINRGRIFQSEIFSYFVR